LPAVQNFTSGLMLRWFAGVRLGDNLCAGAARGTIARIGYTHLHLTTISGEPMLVPYRLLLAQRLVLQRGTPRGARVQALLTQPLTSPAFRERVFRATHLCPYRVPDSPVIVRKSGAETVVEVYTWHRQSTKPIEGFLTAKTTAALQGEGA
jgi:Mechanosensitive ion channel